MYDLKGKLTDVMPWERDEGLAVTWKEECRITNLTLDPAYAANHLQQSSTVRQNSGEEKDIKEFADKNPVFEKELREGEGKNIPFISYSYSFGLNSLAEQEHYKRIARIAPSSTVRQSDNQRMYMIYGEEKDIKKFLDKHPMFEKELREGEKKIFLSLLTPMLLNLSLKTKSLFCGTKSIQL